MILYQEQKAFSEIVVSPDKIKELKGDPVANRLISLKEKMEPEQIPTPNKNALLESDSNKGLANKKVIAIASERGVGKTVFTVNLEFPLQGREESFDH